MPSLYWEVENIDQDGIPCEEHTGWKANVLQFYWGDFGIFLFVGDVYQSED